MSSLKIITIFSLLAFNLGAFSLNKECAAYLDLNDHLNCPERIGFNLNYLKYYGYKYCEKFSDSSQDWNDERKEFIDTVRTCLINSLLDTPHLNCFNMAKIAFNSHTRCYQKAGFCDLAKEQQKSIIKIALGVEVLLSPYQSFKQAIELHLQCKKRSL